MAFYDTNDLRSTLLPTTFISWFMGIGVIEYPVGHRRTVLSLLYTSTICTFYTMCAIFEFLNNDQLVWGIDSRLIYMMYCLYYGAHTVIVCLTIGGSIVYSKKRSRCIMELEDINGIMEKMGVVRSYKRFLVTQIWHFGILVFTTISASIVAYTILTENKKITETRLILRGLFVTLYPYFISTFNEIMFCNFNEMMTGSFEDLNALLESLRVKHPYDSRDSGNNLVQVDVVLRDERKIKILYSIRKLYTRLVCVAKYWNQLNAVFTLTLVVFSIWMLTIRVFTMYILLLTDGLLSFTQIIFIEAAFTTILLAWKLFIIVRSAVLLTTEARRTCGIILWHLHPISSLRSEVRTFSMQLTQSPIRLSVFGLCSLNYSMLQQICAIVITYSVMFIQNMGMPESHQDEQ